MKKIEFRKPRILIVDDEVAMVRSLELLLRPVGEVLKAYSVPEAEDVLCEAVDCVLTDVNMPEESGLALIEKVRKKDPEIPVIIMTAYSSVPEAVEAIQMGAFEYLTKPFSNEALVACVKRAVEKRVTKVGESPSLPRGWICQSPAMKDFLLRLEKLAFDQAPVLLAGEKGVGKNRAAHWLHEQGSQSSKEFLVADPKTRDEDNPLFLRDLAGVGTVFLPEVFSASRKVQDKVFELIQEGRVKILGSISGAIQVQRSPDFREDVYEILSARLLKMPALTERKEDFDLLVQDILSSTQEEMRLKKLEMTEEAVELLRGNTFVGNVKELQNVIGRAALQANKSLISKEDIHFEEPDLLRQLPFSIPVEEGWGRLEYLSKSLEKDLIERTIDKYPESSNSQIASILGTTRRILELRMKEYSIRES